MATCTVGELIDSCPAADELKEWFAECDRLIAFPSDAEPREFEGSESKTPADVFLELSAQSTAARCSTVWTGEHMAYRCKDCGLSDSSCMCVDCFDPALHEGHNYRLYRSQSGGCCDCGDRMAWRETGFCCKHTGNESGAETPLNALMRANLDVVTYTVCAVLAERVRRDVIDASAVAQAGQCVAWLQTMSKVCDSFRNSVCRAFVAGHALAHLCSRVVASPAASAAAAAAAVAASRPLALELPSIYELGLIDDDDDDDDDYDGVDDDDADSRRPRPTRVPLPSCMLDVLVRYGANVPSALQDSTAMLQLELLFNSAYKQVYTISFATYYGHTIRVYMRADTDDLAQKDVQEGLQRSMDRIFCQLFHSSGTVLDLVQRHDLVSVLLDALKELLLETRRNVFASAGQRFRTVEPSHKHVFNNTYSRLAQDLRTVLGHEEVATYLLAHGDDTKIKAVWPLRQHAEGEVRITMQARFTDVLLLMQGMDPHVRRRGDEPHVERETRDWVKAFYLDHEIMLVMAQLLISIRAAVPGSPLAARRCTIAAHAVQAAAHWSYEMFAARSGACMDLCGASYSFHVPLHRMAAATLCAATAPTVEDAPPLQALIASGITVTTGIDELMQRSMRRDAALRAMQFMMTWEPLRLLALGAQITAGMWRRNGNVMPGQFNLYHNPYWHDTGHDLDVASVQIAIVTLGLDAPMPNCFTEKVLLHPEGASALGRSVLECMIACFDTADSMFFLHPGSSADPALVPPNPAEYAAPMAQELFDLIARLVIDRRNAGMTAAKTVRNEVIHYLAVERLTYSRLSSRTCHRLQQLPAFELACKEVAVYRAPDQATMSSGCFELKDEMWSEVSPFFVHYTKQDRQKVAENYQISAARQKRADAGAAVSKLGAQFDSENLLPVPSLAALPLAPAFAELPRRALWSSGLHGLCFTVLHNAVVALAEPYVAAFAPDGVVTNALYLLAMAFQLSVGEAEEEEEAASEGDDDSMLASSSDSSIAALAMYTSANPFKNLWEEVHGQRVHGGFTCLGILLVKLHAAEEYKDQRACIDLIFHFARQRSAYDAERIDALLRPAAAASDAGADTVESHDDRRQREAASRQEAMMSAMRQQQQAFLFDMDDSSSDDDASSSSSSEEGSSSEVSPSGGGGSVARPAGARGESSSAADSTSKRHCRREECAVCRLPSSTSSAALQENPLGVVAYVQRSASVARVGGMSSDEAAAAANGRWEPVDRHDAPVIQSCGHVVHVSCFNDYFVSLQRRHDARQAFEGSRIADITDHEFLCPICRRLGNCLLPLVPRVPSSREMGQAQAGTAVVECDVSWLQMMAAEADPASSPPPPPPLSAALEVQERLETTTADLSDWSTCTVSAQLAASLDYFGRRACFQTDEPVGPAGCQTLRFDVLARAFAANIAHTEVAARTPMLTLDTASSGWGGISTQQAASLDRVSRAFYTLMHSSKQQSLSDDDREAGEEIVEVDPNIVTSAQSEQMGGGGGGGSGAAVDDAESREYVSGEHALAPPSLREPHAHFQLKREAKAITAMLLCDSVFAPLKADPFLIFVEWTMAGPVLLEDANRTIRMLQVLWKLAVTQALLHAAILHSREVNESDQSGGGGSGQRLPTIPDQLETLQGEFGAVTNVEDWYGAVAKFTIANFDRLAGAKWYCGRYPSEEATAFSKRFASSVAARGVAASLEPLLLPFLRRAAILIESCAMSSSSARVTSGESSAIAAWLRNDPGTRTDGVSEFDVLREALNLRTVAGIFPSTTTPGQTPLWQRWIMKSFGGPGGPVGLAQLPLDIDVPPPFSLIQLPTLYSQMYLKFVDEECASHTMLPMRARKHPAICLLCGERICVADAECCSTTDPSTLRRTGGATKHAARCNAGTCAVLLLKECLVLVMAPGQRRCFWGALYLDEYGEEDRKLLRGKPLFLNAQRCEQLRLTLASNGFSHDTKYLSIAEPFLTGSRY